MSANPDTSDVPEAPTTFTVRRISQKKLVLLGGAALLVITIVTIVLMLVFGSSEKKPAEPQESPAATKKIKELTRENASLKQELNKAHEDYDALKLEHEKEKAKAMEAAKNPALARNANSRAAQKKAADEDMSEVAEALKGVKGLKLER